MRSIYNQYINSDHFNTRVYPDDYKRRTIPDADTLLKRFLPDGIDSGDIFLLLLLFFLYIESDDSDFLIVLAVIAFSVFKKRE